MVATSGARLLEDDALDALRTRLIPLATLITPNLPEAELLLGQRIADAQAHATLRSPRCAHSARARVLLKGGHLPGDGDVVDLFRRRTAPCRDRPPAPAARSPRHRLHAGLGGRGQPLPRPRSACRSCTAATDYVHAALRGGYRPGRSDDRGARSFRRRPACDEHPSQSHPIAELDRPGARTAIAGRCSRAFPPQPQASLLWLPALGVAAQALPAVRRSAGARAASPCSCTNGAATAAATCAPTATATGAIASC